MVASKVCVDTTVQGMISLGVNDETVIENTFEAGPNFLQGVFVSLTRTRTMSHRVCGDAFLQCEFVSQCGEMSVAVSCLVAWHSQSLCVTFFGRSRVQFPL